MQTVGPSGCAKAFHIRVSPREEGKRKEKKKGGSDADPRRQDEAWRGDIRVLCFDQQIPRGWVRKTHAHGPPPETGEAAGVAHR